MNERFLLFVSPIKTKCDKQQPSQKSEFEMQTFEDSVGGKGWNVC